MKFAVAALTAFLAAATGRGAAPEVDYPIKPIGGPMRVMPYVPVGKTLLIPVTARDADGDPLSYKVTSSSPLIMVRAKTGNPMLRLEVSHANGGPDDPPYSGTMDFMLFADWLPITAGFVAGLAQSGYYDNTLFHRLADLGGGGGTTGYIFQGGDPMGTGGGGPGMVDNDPQTAWKFQNEFHPGTIFTGRGQLAMANAGTQTGYSLGAGGTLIVPDYLDTNGSQFFITDGQPRHLDFKHNIFGQMLRGWELLPKMRATRTSSSRPEFDLKITSAKVLPNETDAVLVISARGKTAAFITVRVTDPAGNSAVTSFLIQSVPDTSNCSPFFRRMDARTTPRDTLSVFGLPVTDLEFDYLDMQHSLLPLSASLGPKASLMTQSGPVAQIQPFAGYAGLINMGFSLRQYDVSQGGFQSISDYTNAYVAAGERDARPEGGSFEALPGVAFTNAIAGRLYDTDSGSGPGNFTAKINWGDGTPLATASVVRDSSEPGSSVFNAIAGHTYTKPGVYPVVVEFLGDNGGRFTSYGTARVTASGLRPAGEKLELSNGRVVERVIATFSDAAPAPVADYTATVDWGDGYVTKGKITRDLNTGRFLVRGTHNYVDSEGYSVRVRIHKKNAAPTEDAFAWSRIEPIFASAIPHLPPFPHPKLTIAWNSGPTKNQTGTPGPNYQVNYDGVFVIINTGNRQLKASKLRFWLSNDRVLNTTGPGADLPLKINNQKELNIIPFPPGAGGSGLFNVQMPRGQSTARKYLLAEAVYRDPIADYDGSEKIIVTGPLPPSVLLSNTAGLTTTEAGGTASFTITLDSPPETPAVNLASIVTGSPAAIHTKGAHGLSTGDEVLISGVIGSSPEINGVHTVTQIDSDTFTISMNVTVAGSGGKVQFNPIVTIPLESSDTTEGTVPASVVFNSQNWNVPQTVTVTGVDDNIHDGNQEYKITLRAAQSRDSLYNGFAGGEVKVVNTDNDSAPSP